MTAATQRTHGVRGWQTTGTLPEALQAQQADDHAALVRDLGSDLSAQKSALVEKAIEVLTLTRLYSADLALRGPFTPKGRVRATTAGYLAGVDRLVRLFAILGIERKAKDSLTLDQYLRERYGAARSPQGASSFAGDPDMPSGPDRVSAGRVDGPTGLDEGEVTP